MQPSSRQSLHSLSVTRAMSADAGKYLDAALAVVGTIHANGGQRGFFTRTVGNPTTST